MAVDITTLQELQRCVAEEKITLVQFHAEWCTPCKAVSPYIRGVCSHYHIPLVLVDVDASDEIVAHYSVESVPTLVIVMQNGSMYGPFNGGTKTNINTCIQKVLELANQ